MPESDIDAVEAHDPLFFRKEIKILQFWRGLLGEDGFQRHENDDLVRWYLALKVQGPTEVRALLNERRCSRPMPVLHGVVDRGSHPPVALVEQWLENEETRVHASPVLFGVAAFVILTFLVASQLSTCSLSYTPNLLALQPAGPAIPLPPSPSIQVPVTAGGNAFTNGQPPAPAMPSPPSYGGSVPAAISPPQAPAALPALTNGAGRSPGH